MHRQLLSIKKARAFSLAAFLLGLGVISFGNSFWPEVMVVIGVALAIRQALLRKFYEALLSLFIFIGIFFTQKFDSAPKVILAVLFFTGALFLLIREYIETKELPEDQKEEHLNHLIEEAKDDQKS